MDERRSIVAAIDMPLRSVDGNVKFYAFERGAGEPEHLLIEFGAPARGGCPLVRVHSECLTGDTFGSLRCDCGAQLQHAVRILSKAGGYLIYLRQEGRGIGLHNKLRAYGLQDEGFDTFEANRRLGLADDCRDYRAAAEMLLALGVSRIELLTNNPEKEGQLTACGIRVDRRIRTPVYVNPHNHRYLSAKVAVSKHSITLTEEA